MTGVSYLVHGCDCVVVVLDGVLDLCERVIGVVEAVVGVDVASQGKGGPVRGRLVRALGVLETNGKIYSYIRR